MDLTNRAALITGGKRIGAAVAVELAARGMDIALSYNRSQHEAEATAQAVISLLKDPARAARMGARNRELALSRNWPAYCSEQMQIYREVVATETPRASRISA